MAIQNYDDPFNVTKKPLVQLDPSAFSDPTAGFEIPTNPTPPAQVASQTTDPTTAFSTRSNTFVRSNQGGAVVRDPNYSDPTTTVNGQPAETQAEKLARINAEQVALANKLAAEKAAREAVPKTYINTPGWEESKLNDPTHQSVKYRFLRTVQDMGITGTQARGNLQQVVDKMKAWYPNAKVTGDDTIDFGDGYGSIDVIQGNAANSWWWGPEGQAGGGTGGAGGAGGTGGTGGAGGVAPTTPELSDVEKQRQAMADEFSANPASDLLSQLALDRVERLSKTQQVPALDAYVQQMLDNRGTNDARATELANEIIRLADSYQKPTFAEEAMLNRIEQLKGPVYTDQQSAALRAQAFDALERRRQATLTNAAEDVSNRGFMPSSGVRAEQQRTINQDFEQTRTGMEAQLLLDSIKQGQANADQVVSLSKDVTDSRMARAERGTELKQMAQQAQASGDLVSLNYLAQIADIESQMNAQADQQERERLIAAGIPADIQTNNVQMALQILGMGGTPAQIVAALTGVAQAGNQAESIRQSASASKWGGLGALASSALDAYASYKKPTPKGP
jgi:hypothetical protein